MFFYAGYECGPNSRCILIHQRYSIRLKVFRMYTEYSLPDAAK